MSGFKGHLFFAYLILLTAYIAQIRYNWNLNLPTDWLNITGIIIIVGIFSLLPDVDTPSSKASTLILNTALIAIIFFAYKQQGYIIMGIAATLLLLSLASHRGLTHSIISGLIFAIPLWFINPLFYIIAAISYILHITIDGELHILPRKF